MKLKYKGKVVYLDEEDLHLFLTFNFDFSGDFNTKYLVCRYHIGYKNKKRIRLFFHCGINFHNKVTITLNVPQLPPYNILHGCKQCGFLFDKELDYSVKGEYGENDFGWTSK